MLKKVSVGLLFIGAALVSTPSFALLKQKQLEIELLKSKGREIAGRHVFPIYQKQKSMNKRFFVAIRTQNAGLQNHVIDAPNSEDSKNTIWSYFTKDLSKESKGQDSLDFDEALNDLEESTLVGFYVFSSKDWQVAQEGSDIAPYFISDEELVATVADACPYFDNTNPPSASDVENYGVKFQASESRALGFAKKLMKSVKAEEAAQSSNKDL